MFVHFLDPGKFTSMEPQKGGWNTGRWISFSLEKGGGWKMNFSGVFFQKHDLICFNKLRRL